MRASKTVLAASLLALALVVSAAAMALSPAEAGRGAGGKRGGSTPTPTGTCSVSPNPVSAGADFTISGSGYGAGRYLTIAIVSGGGTSYQWVQASSAGSFSTTARVFTSGSNSVKVHDSTNGALIGGCSFSSS